METQVRRLKNFSQGKEVSRQAFSPSPELIWLLEEAPAGWHSSEQSEWILQDKVQRGPSLRGYGRFSSSVPGQRSVPRIFSSCLCIHP